MQCTPAPLLRATTLAAMHDSKLPVRPLRQAAARAIAAAALLALLATPALAQWKWRDASGQITASDRPPPKEIPDRDILERPTAPIVRRAPVPEAPASAAATAPAQAAAPKTALETEVEARKKAEEQQAAAKARADEKKQAEQRAENCRRARSHLAALESGQRIARINDKGEREILDDKSIADEIRTARGVVASDCR